MLLIFNFELCVKNKLYYKYKLHGSCNYFREMIFEQLFYDNFLSYTRIVFLLFFSIALVFVSILAFLFIFWLFNKLSKKGVVQIILFILFEQPFGTFF